MKRFRPHASFRSDPLAGVLQFDGSFPDVNVEMGSWAIAFGGDVVVLSQAEFNQVVTQSAEESGG
ncbi:hypothetical protein GCM10007269_37410 [Microbacterium murale]|uniref:Uncharacterized protein n=1 Tax=Microbacterium murale TaxID=1081040 RepID=A0ABQ1S3C4_9MICO|nr:hypothetical protein GCM10007269_37410 [Microbacterium murale]